MKMGIFGLGYVGTTAAACLARDGHFVVGVDNVPAKIAALSAGRASFVEQGLEALHTQRPFFGSSRSRGPTFS